MYQVEDKPETIHLYVVREGPARPPIAPIILSLLGLSLLIVLGIAIPYKQPVTRLAIGVPAVPLYVRSFSASVVIIPTGVKTYPATTAHGRLLIRNGSVIGQKIPASFVVSGAVTDAAVYVPGATVDGDGIATVSAHLLTSGINMSANAVNVVIGTSLFIRNPAPFTGGRPAYSVKYVTEQDKQSATILARNHLSDTITGLHYPCTETMLRGVTNSVSINWRCQFVTFSIPSYMHVLRARLIDKNLIVDVVFTPPLRRMWVK
jgi:hypothetical protein